MPITEKKLVAAKHLTSFRDDINCIYTQTAGIIIQMFPKTIIADDSMLFKVSANNVQVFVPLQEKKNKNKKKFSADFFI